MQTCYQLIWLAAERTPDRLAMVDDASERQFTYAELIVEIETVAAGLAERGITKGTRVATALPGGAMVLSMDDYIIAKNMPPFRLGKLTRSAKQFVSY